jgi:hypothetical protein
VIQQFSLVALNSTITCIASKPSIGRYRWVVTSATGTRTGAWLVLSAGVAVGFAAPPPGLGSALWPNPMRVQTTIPLGVGASITAKLDVRCVNVAALSAVLEVEVDSPALFSASPVSIEVLDTRYADTKYLATIDGTGLPTPPMPVSPSNSFADWSSEGARPRAARTRAPTTHNGKGYG